MIQAIKIPVVVNGNEKELSFDYDELDEDVCIYLDNNFVCRMNYNNLKPSMKKMIEKW